MELTDDMDEISKQILATYKKDFHRLAWIKRRHFTYRAGLVDGDSFWDEKLMKLTIESKEKVVLMSGFDEIGRDEYGKQYEYVALADKPNDLGKVAFGKKYPMYRYWEDYLTHLRYLYLGGVRFERKWVENVDVEGLTERCLDNMSLSWVPVWSIEILTDLRWLLGNRTYKFLSERFRGENFNMNDKGEWMNYVYGLTHVVIGESEYYRRRVEKQNWALKIIHKHFREWVGVASVDLAVEMALCLRLGGVNLGADEDLLNDRIKEAFSDDLGRLKREVGGINQAEHRNIILVMFLRKEGF